MNYLNAKPLVYGIRNHPVMEQVELIEDYPSNLAKMLEQDEIDVGLIPIAATQKFSEWNIVGDFCIGTEGEVASVCIFSEVPMEAIEEIVMDYQSRTSVALARILLKEYWRKEVKITDAVNDSFRAGIKGNKAALVIGDRALEQRQHSKYIYDLGLAWKEHTGLPFVFAAWISKKELPKEFIREFNEAQKQGIENIAAILEDFNYSSYDLVKYFEENIRYCLDEQKHLAITTFLQKLKEL